MNKDAKYWINKLNLQEHSEGGYFVETYKSEKFVNLPEYDGPRHACTAINYLLVRDQFSSFHRMKSDEIWHFYAGSRLSLHIIETRNRRLQEVKLGADVDNGGLFQTVVKSGYWFAASDSLVGCTVSPGFDYCDWELGDIETLARMYPQHKSIIEKYSR